MSRAIDHLVLPTADLAVARRRLTALGFNVAPEGVHPFGTHNACVYLKDGTFLEPLAIHDAALARDAAAKENVFVARDAAFRSRFGQEGFSALVFATDDANSDHAEFERAGVSAGAMLSFSRPSKDSDGKTDEASFQLAFAADVSAPNAFFFTCQRLNAPAIDRTALQEHANGVLKIISIDMEAASDDRVKALLSTVLHADETGGFDGFSYQVANADISVGERQVDFAEPDPGLLLTGVRLGVARLDRLSDILVQNHVEHHRAGGIITVPPGPGQGTEFSFKEL